MESPFRSVLGPALRGAVGPLGRVKHIITGTGPVLDALSTGDKVTIAYTAGSGYASTAAPIDSVTVEVYVNGLLEAAGLAYEVVEGDEVFVREIVEDDNNNTRNFDTVTRVVPYLVLGVEGGILALADGSTLLRVAA